MITLHKISFPLHNGNRMCPFRIWYHIFDYDELAQWLSENYSGYNEEEFRDSVVRHHDYALKEFAPTIYGDMTDLEQGKYHYIIHQQLPNQNADWDAKYKEFMLFYIYHSTWDTPGTYEVLTYQDEAEVPEPWRSNLYKF